VSVSKQCDFPLKLFFYLWGAFCFASDVVAQTVPGDDGWKNLDRVSHSSSLAFIKRDGSCERGTVLKVDGTEVTVKRYGQNPVTIRRQDLYQGGEGGPNNLVYSERSSWSDVIGAKPGHAESLLLGMKDGKRYNGKPVSTTGTTIVLTTLTATETLAKQDILTVDYVRQKPLTDGEEYIAQETPFLLLFSPMSYVRAAGVSLKLDVRVYDASKPEDNSEVICKPTKPVTALK